MHSERGWAKTHLTADHNQTVGKMHAFAVSSRYLQTRSNKNTIEQIGAAINLPAEPLTQKETEYARIAWTYFDTFTNKNSGLPRATDDDSAISMWNLGATLLAITSASRLAILSKPVARKYLDRCLRSLAALPLTPNHLPFSAYDAATLDPCDRSATARDIMRLVAGLIVTAHHNPDFAPEISLILQKWRLSSLISQGRFTSARIASNGALRHETDGHLGFEQYAARAALLIGLPVDAALDIRTHLTGHIHKGVVLPADSRGQAITTSEPFLLDGLEFGWKKDMQDTALAVFLAQKQRFETTGTLTAVTEDARAHKPYRSIDAILAGATPFASRDNRGRDTTHLRCLSTKAAFAWSALLPTPYSQKLRDAVTDLHTPEGWQTGRYEQTGKANAVLSLDTNAVILEALHYKSLGPLFPEPAPLRRRREVPARGRNGLRD